MKREIVVWVELASPHGRGERRGDGDRSARACAGVVVVGKGGGREGDVKGIMVRAKKISGSSGREDDP